MNSPLPMSKMMSDSPDSRRKLLKDLLRRRNRLLDGVEIRADTATRHEPFPLTDIQRAYWLGRDPGFPLGGVGIHGYFELDCTGLDLPRLERAWNDVVRRHDMLRCVVNADGTAHILADVPVYRIRYEDLRGLSAVEREVHLLAIRKELSHQVFNLSQWPPFDIRALRLSEDITRLVLSEDATHTDLASSEIIAQDWLALYKGENLEPMPDLSFRDCALSGFGNRQSLPTDTSATTPLPDPPHLPPAPGHQALDMRFHRRNHRLAPAQWQKFRAQASHHGLTASDALLAVYADILRAWNSEPRFLLNVTIQNRPEHPPEIAHIAGDFTDFVLVDIDLREPCSFADRARRHRDALWLALEDPSSRGISALQARATAQAGSPFLAPFVYTSALGTSGYRALEGLGRVVHEVTQTPQVLIDQQVLAKDQTLHLSWDSVDAAFAPGVTDAMFSTLAEQLEDLAETPDSWLSTQAVPLPADQKNMRERLNAHTSAIPDIRLEDLFLQTAAARPGAAALIDNAGTVTFEELATGARALASALSDRLSQPPDGPVLVWLPKSREQVLSVLAILLSGRPYLAVDPATPQDRLSEILDLTGTVAVITGPEKHQPLLLGDNGLIEVDCGERSTAPLAANAPKSETAYILFTSGSTGEPKGVPISHRSVVNRMEDVRQRFGLNRNDRAIAISALHHDLSVFDIFGCLVAAGGGLVLPPEARGGRCDPAVWADLMGSEKVTLWNSVPAFMEMLTALPGHRLGSCLDRLRHVFLSGDLVPSTLPDKLRGLAPNTRVHSLGGPTETTVWDIAFPDAACPEGWDVLPYGRPMTNAQYHVRHTDGSDCPDWVTGTIWIGGAGLSSGYFGGSEEDRRRFQSGSIGPPALFKSSDLGRFRPDGLIEIMGRADRMVKLRGQRVELGDVEARLRRLDHAARAVAFLLPSSSGQTRLAAALTARSGTPDLPSDRIDLPDPAALPPAPFHDRESALAFSPAPVSREKIAAFCSAFCDVSKADGTWHRLHPSAGAKYALNLEILVRSGRVETLDEGLYQIEAGTRQLKRVGPAFPFDKDAVAPRNNALFKDAAIVVLIRADLSRLYPDYAGASRDLALLEAGYIGQLAQSACAALDLSSCPLGGLTLPDDLHTKDQPLVHALLIGARPGDSRRQTWQRSTCWSPEQKKTAQTEIERLLPPHMRPAPLLFLDQFPLTANGKPDIDALARYCLEEAESASSLDTGPMDPLPVPEDLQAALTDIIGPGDWPASTSFAELGVFSADLVRLHVRLLDAGFDIPITELFSTPTIAALADRLLGPGSSPAGTARGTARRRRLQQTRARQ
ncbi:Phenyloxazoline synthase MbtB [Labrenzia sp. THAF82]|uniref:non-ribosomal peptide synthetase n=1 Tax=Labrenzia sp. THAF82 TaxID=2587861 RepID=UPI001269644E|nr:non-ribosomal peptide synthetase [Labrenzia sp. THAF82]QFT32219.1 Phenyloxazoline synthase MbtB [Labrenzia sp. THAF82]